MFVAIRRAFVSDLAPEHQHVTSYPVLSGKASQSVNTRYSTRYRCPFHGRQRYKPANWPAPRDDVWLRRMLPMPP